MSVSLNKSAVVANGMRYARTVRPYTVLDMPSMKEINRTPKRWRGVSTFAGCGGASTGLKMAGVDVLWINEFVPGALRTYGANASRNTILDGRDVREVTGADLMRQIGVRRGELDWFDGSPPCKCYSSASRHNRVGKSNDQKVLYSEGLWQRVDDLFANHVRLVRELQPRITAIENVTGIAESSSIGAFVDICDAIRDAGYELQVGIIDPTLLGVPQTRKRVVFLGIRRDLYRRGVHHVWPRPYTSPIVTVRDVVPEARWISKGKGEWKDARNPSPTLTVTAGRGDEFSGLSAAPFYRDAHGEIHQYAIPQLRRIFGFPDDFVLGGNYHNRYERLARSHTPLAVYNVAGVMLREMDRVLGRRS